MFALFILKWCRIFQSWQKSLPDTKGELKLSPHIYGIKMEELFVGIVALRLDISKIERNQTFKDMLTGM